MKEINAKCLYETKVQLPSQNKLKHTNIILIKRKKILSTNHQILFFHYNKFNQKIITINNEK